MPLVTLFMLVHLEKVSQPYQRNFQVYPKKPVGVVKRNQRYRVVNDLVKYRHRSGIGIQLFYKCAPGQYL